MDHLESRYKSSGIRFAASMAARKRQERIYNNAMSVHSYHTIVDYLLWLWLQRIKLVKS